MPPFFTDPMDAAQLARMGIRASAPTAMDPDAAADMLRVYNALRPQATAVPRNYPIAIRPEVGVANPNPADIPLSQAESDAVLGRQPSRWARAKRVASNAARQVGNTARGAAQAVRNGASATARGVASIPKTPLGGGALGAALLAGYGYGMGKLAEWFPERLAMHAQDAVGEDAGYQNKDLEEATTQVTRTAVPGMQTAMPEYPGELPPVPAGLRKNSISARSSVSAPVTRRRAGGKKRVAASTPAEAAPVTTVDPLEQYIRGASDYAGPMRDYSGPLITPAQLTPEELNAPESADLAFNRGIHTTVQAPQFGDDDLAVYDWQTGKPKTDIFGFQIRSADPRDHIGDPRWGTITQEMIDNYR